MKSKYTHCMVFNCIMVILLLLPPAVHSKEIGDPQDIFKGSNNAKPQKPPSMDTVQKSLQDFGRSLTQMLQGTSKDKESSEDSAKEETKTQPMQPVIAYEGYSQEYVGITKQLLQEGKINKAYDCYCNEWNENGYLQLLEQGTLSLIQGEPEQAEDSFALAEYILIDRMRVPKVGEYMTKMTSSLAGVISGMEDIGPYWGTDYERILMLNYKSIAYLLEGERKAYNVTRRAINWQNMAKRAFDEKVREAKIKLADEKKDMEEEGHDVDKLGVDQTLDKVFSPMQDIAKRVPSAYVNPFGFYVAGMVQEFESFQDASLRHNARISYKKALELNPKSKVLRTAVRDLKRGRCPAGKRLLHVVAGTGFAPERKVVVFGVGTEDLQVPLKLPLYEPCSSMIASMVVYTPGGRRLAGLSTVADIEAICLRHQQDMMPLNTLKVTAVAARTIFEKAVLHNLGTIGHLIGSVHDEMSEGDTRSWMSLPAELRAARVYIPKNLRSIKLVSYAKGGRRLATKRVSLDRSSHNFVYARVMNDHVYAYPNQTLWLAK